jgi:hypothetical protein
MLSQEIADALAAHPEFSARQIAREVGAAPATVSRLRSRISSIQPTKTSPIPDVGLVSMTDSERHSGHSDDGRGSLGLGQACLAERWRSDIALSSTPVGTELANWLDATAVSDCWIHQVGDVPLSRIYLIADEARHRAAWWENFAQCLEARTRPATAAASS